jgi:SAM-dependent methyltransferase
VTDAAGWDAEPAEWDAEFAAILVSDLLPRLAQQAIGADYPFELRPYGFTTWTLLREIGTRLDLRAGQTLLDLGTGEGGIGLWLAQEHHTRLIALDFSAEALRAAERFAAGRNTRVEREYRQADFTDTGLAAASVDAAVCFDVLHYLADRDAALREVRRILRPGGRIACTVFELAGEDYRSTVEDAGLRVLHCAEVAGWREPTRRIFELWLDNADAMRAELGEAVAATLLAEAAEVVTGLGERRYLLLVASPSPSPSS